MSRPIKFKGWNGKRWTREYTLYEMLTTQLDHNGLKETWVQFTGLKDKNGKEIYDQDVVEREGLRYLVTIDDYGINFLGGGSIEHPNRFVNFSESGLIWIPQTWTVIGNAHESPNLLKS